MGEITGISWCDATINFWHGCEKVSAGCKYCYMYREKEKYGQVGNDVKRTSANTIVRILKQLNSQRAQRLSEGNKEPLKIFTCSWSDFFIEEADEWRPAAWNIIRANPQFIWIILSKRLDRAKQFLPDDWGSGWPNVWIIASAEDQSNYNHRVIELADIPAVVRGISMEPLLGPVEMQLDSELTIEGITKQVHEYIDWVIIGGESGNESGKWLYRPCDEQWMDSIMKQSLRFNIPVFVKQLGTHIAKANGLKYAAEDWKQWPAKFKHLKVRQFPN